MIQTNIVITNKYFFKAIQNDLFVFFYCYCYFLVVNNIVVYSQQIIGDVPSTDMY